MKRIFTAILSLALVSASFIGCNEETPEAVERHLNPLTNEALVEGVEVSTEVFLYGATKTYTLKYKLNEEAVVSCPEGWTAEYDAEANILTVAAPAAAGASAPVPDRSH